jgi:hypothetical protein
MIRKTKDWDNVKAFGQIQRLPKGAYICKIMGAEVIWNGDGIKVSYDIAEGDYKDFFANDYRSQTGEDRIWKGSFVLYVPKEDGSRKDELTKRRLRTFTDHLEDVNNGYHFDWDEQKWKGKMFGGLFRIRQSRDRNDPSKIWDNIEPNAFTSFENIRSGNYTLPDDYLVDAGKSSKAPSANDFVNMSGSDEDLPF